VPKTRPETIENRWDVLYRDYPEVYTEFASVPSVGGVDLLRRFDFKDKVVVDVGSGSGLSTFRFARVATRVVGVELEDAMRELAEANARRTGVSNVRFVKGDARSIPLPDSSADVVTAWTLAVHPPEGFRDFIREAERVTRPGGWVVSVQVAPGWYGGELSHLIGDDENLRIIDDIFVREFGFRYEDVDFIQDFGSVEKMLRTYGFIYGHKAIDYIKQHRMTAVRRRDRVHFKTVEKQHPSTC
jgi:ubiquinone/menaquinone biosynthesis C-methylase UbiE